MSYPDLYLLIDGQRLGAEGRRTVPVINPATEEVLGQLAGLARAGPAAARPHPAQGL
jgi:succinate-semialdehyde dehydrogenase / glutarate-semialdehyde dehydrogenase